MIGEVLRGLEHVDRETTSRLSPLMLQQVGRIAYRMKQVQPHIKRNPAQSSAIKHNHAQSTLVVQQAGQSSTAKRNQAQDNATNHNHAQSRAITRNQRVCCSMRGASVKRGRRRNQAL